MVRRCHHTLLPPHASVPAAAHRTPLPLHTTVVARSHHHKTPHPHVSAVTCYCTPHAAAAAHRHLLCRRHNMPLSSYDAIITHLCRCTITPPYTATRIRRLTHLPPYASASAHRCMSPPLPLAFASTARCRTPPPQHASIYDAHRLTPPPPHAFSMAEHTIASTVGKVPAPRAAVRTAPGPRVVVGAVVGKAPAPRAAVGAVSALREAERTAPMPRAGVGTDLSPCVAIGPPPALVWRQGRPPHLVRR